MELKFVVENQFTIQEIEDGVESINTTRTIELNFACVYYGDKYTFPYVRNLHSMVERNLTIPHRFICFTDNTVIHRRKEFKNTNIEFKSFKRHDFNG